MSVRTFLDWVNWGEKEPPWVWATPFQTRGTPDSVKMRHQAELPVLNLSHFLTDYGSSPPPKLRCHAFPTVVDYTLKLWTPQKILFLKFQKSSILPQQWKSQQSELDLHLGSCTILNGVLCTEVLRNAWITVGTSQIRIGQREKIFIVGKPEDEDI